MLLLPRTNIIEGSEFVIVIFADPTLHIELFNLLFIKVQIELNNEVDYLSKGIHMRLIIINLVTIINIIKQPIILFIAYMLCQSPSLLNRTSRTAHKEEPIENKLLIALLKDITQMTVRPFKLINQLIPLLLQQPFFKNFSNNFRLLSEIANKVELIHFKEGQQIYKIRQLSNYFYLILEGTVNLTIPEEIQNDEQIVHEQYLNDSQIFNNFFQVKGASEAQQRNEQVVRIIKILQKGECFGQMMGEKSIRATSAIAVDDCTLMAMNKKTYQLLLKAQVKTQNRSKFIFLTSLPILAPLHTFSIESICLLMKQQELTYGQYLFHQGQLIKKIYIIYSGEFKLMKAVAKHAATSLQRKTKGQSQYKNILLPKKQVPFIIIQAGQILGDGQLISHNQVYQHMCICQSQSAKIFYIDKRQYFKNITHQKESFQEIRKLIEEKWMRRKTKTNNFISRRSRQSKMNVLLNSNEWAVIPKAFKITTKSPLNISTSSLTSQQLISNQNFFINELNKTISQNPRLNRFSVNKKKCPTQASSRQKVSPLIKNTKKDGVPHCVQDIVTLVKLKSNFLRRFRKQKKRQKNIFKFNKQDVPLFIKNKYSRIDEAKL